MGDVIRDEILLEYLDKVVSTDHTLVMESVSWLSVLVLFKPGESVIIEVIFGIPGMGSYIFTSITQNDYNAVMVVLLISSLLTLIGMLLADLAYALVDPRITFD